MTISSCGTTPIKRYPAPDLFELFTPPSYSHNTGIDPKTNKSVSLYSAIEGNPNLLPEDATTVSGGVVLTPTFIPGFSASFDWYSIVVKGAVFSASQTQITQQCALGVQAYCNEEHFGDPSEAADYPGALNVIVNAPLNASSFSTSGLDFAADYSMGLFSGNLGWHLVGNYLDTYTETVLGAYQEGAGSLVASSSAPGQLTSTPKLHFNLSATYTDGPWSGTIQGRIKGPAKLNIFWQNSINVDDNNIPWVGYLDLRGSYKWNEHVQFYTSINDVNDAPPPLTPTAVGGSGTNTQLYDGLGRVYQAGIRVNY